MLLRGLVCLFSSPASSLSPLPPLARQCSVFGCNQGDWGHPARLQSVFAGRRLSRAGASGPLLTGGQKATQVALLIV